MSEPANSHISFEAWLLGEQKRLEHLKAVIKDNPYIAANPTVYRETVDNLMFSMVDSYATLLGILAQHPNIRNMP